MLFICHLTMLSRIRFPCAHESRCSTSVSIEIVVCEPSAIRDENVVCDLGPARFDFSSVRIIRQ